MRGGFQMFYKGIGINFLSIINRDICSWWSRSTQEEMIIPKIIGTVKKGFLRHFRSDRLLQMKNRLRADEVEVI
jgi:hypothetical protein